MFTDAEPDSPGTPDNRNVSGRWSLLACCLGQESDTRESGESKGVGQQRGVKRKRAESKSLCRGSKKE